MVVPACPALRPVTFELHESRYEALGAERFAAQLAAIRAVTGRTVQGVA